MEEVGRGFLGGIQPSVGQHPPKERTFEQSLAYQNQAPQKRALEPFAAHLKPAGPSAKAYATGSAER